MDSTLALQALTPEKLVERIPGVPLTEARKVVAQVHRDEPVHPSSSLSAASVRLVQAVGAVPTLQVVEEQRSQVDPFRKYVLRTADGALVETVRIPLEKAGRFSVCVSSQVGCALQCAFCATGRMGLVRNLQTWEIVEQVRVVHRVVKAEGAGRVHGVVFQGMGEPMANLDRVLDAIAVLSESSALAIDQRAMTVSTSGLPAGIRRLAREAPKVRLGLSIHSALTTTRRALMPIDNAHPLDEVLDAAAEHVALTGLAPMWTVTPLEGVNDSEAHARAFAELALQFKARTAAMPRISVIPYNRIDEDAADPFRRVADAAEQRFRDVMAAMGVFTIKRYSGGGDVAAACGQLATAVPPRRAASR